MNAGSVTAALPGTPENNLSVREIVALAVQEARLYRASGVDGIGIENMHDLPYLRGAVGPEIVAAMTLVGQAVKAESPESITIGQSIRIPGSPPLRSGAPE